VPRRAPESEPRPRSDALRGARASARAAARREGSFGGCPAPRWLGFARGAFLAGFGALLAIGPTAICPTARADPRPEEFHLVPIGATWRYQKGLREPSPDDTSGDPTILWTQLDFDDAEWPAGETGIGYGDRDDATVLIDMEGLYPSLYARKRFRLPDGSEIRSLALRIDYDDGFVAYLNGIEVARSGLAGRPPRFDDPATDHEAGSPETFEIDPERLIPGVNVLAVQVHNASLLSSDLSFVPELIAEPDLCPSAAASWCVQDLGTGAVTVYWTPIVDYDSVSIARNGAFLTSVPGDTTSFTDPAPPTGPGVCYEVWISHRGVDCPPLACWVDLVAPDDVIVAEGNTWRFLRGGDPEPSDWMLGDFDDSFWESGPTGIGYGDGDDATVLGDMQEIAGVQTGYLSVFARRNFDLALPLDEFDLILRVRFDDGVALYLNGTPVLRANLPLDTQPRFDTAATRTVDSAVLVEAILDPGLLVPGRNLLAASVHNAALASSDLSFVAWIYRRARPVVPAPRFWRGDVDGDLRLDITDPIGLLGFLFLGASEPPCADAADSDDSGEINISDAIRLLGFLFLGQEGPAAPVFECAEDSTADALPPCAATAC
jgi:hypothetical protein